MKENAEGSCGDKMIKMKARTGVGRGEEGPLCDPDLIVLLGGRSKIWRGE